MPVAKLKVRRRPRAQRRAVWSMAGPAVTLQRRHAVRKMILDAACRVYARDGFSGVTLRALAGELRCGAPAIYRYFRSKDEIIRALKETALELLETVWIRPDTKDPLADLRSSFLAYYEFSKTYPVHFRLTWVDSMAPALDPSRPFFAAIVNMRRDVHRKVQRCIDAGLFPPDTKVASVSTALWSAVHGPAVLREVRDIGSELDFDAVAVEALDLAIAGVRAGTGTT